MRMVYCTAKERSFKDDKAIRQPFSARGVLMETLAILKWLLVDGAAPFSVHRVAPVCRPPSHANTIITPLLVCLGNVSA